MTATATEPLPAFPIIGSIVPDPRRPGSVRLLVQGRPLLTVSRDVVDGEKLSPGMVLTSALYQRLCQAADLEAGYRTALRFIERRPFAARDLTRRLVLKGHPPEAAAAAVERAREAGWINDEEFTRHYIATRAARGRGPVRLRRDLAALGVDRALVDRIMTEVLGAGGEEGPDVAELARKRLTQLEGRKLPRPVLRRRLLAFLARRGFMGGEASAAVTSVLGPRA